MKVINKITKLITIVFLLLFIPFSIKAEEKETVYSEGYFYYHLKNGYVSICGYFGSEETVSIPSSIATYPVSSIETDAFNNCDTITTIKLPDTIMEVQEGAFTGASSLMSVFDYQGNDILNTSDNTNNNSSSDTNSDSSSTNSSTVTIESNGVAESVDIVESNDVSVSQKENQNNLNAIQETLKENNSSNTNTDSKTITDKKESNTEEYVSQTLETEISEDESSEINLAFILIPLVAIGIALIVAVLYFAKKNKDDEDNYE